MPKSAYNLRPSIDVHAFGAACSGYDAIAQRLHSAFVAGGEEADRVASQACAASGSEADRAASQVRAASGSETDRVAARPHVLVFECYPGTDYQELRDCLFERLHPSALICADDYAWGIDRVQERIKDTVTDDRIFGVMSHYHVEDFYDEADLARARQTVADAVAQVVGVAARPAEVDAQAANATARAAEDRARAAGITAHAAQARAGQLALGPAATAQQAGVTTQPAEAALQPAAVTAQPAEATSQPAAVTAQPAEATAQPSPASPDNAPAGPVIVYGVGASLIAPEGLLVYVDLTRWEITLRFRAGLRNWKTDNADEDPLRKIKRGYFFEWRIADRLKRSLHERIDFLMETNVPGSPKMVDGDAYRAGLAHAAQRPFRLVPYFDESVWGGQWMKERFGLDPSKRNYGWSFDGVPEENGVILAFDGAEVEVPAINLVLTQPDELLGPKVRARYGAEFPIRFDFLDTMGGGNLSLQVHPRTEYIQDAFGMPYTQDESYYILDAADSSEVYLGVREDTTKEALVADLRKAAAGEAPFPAERHVNVFPVKKHDHVLIPAGTIHCSGADTVVLEISATPYNFTFKLWDWGRVGLDGKPRPINIAHGEPNIVMERTAEFCQRELVVRADDERENLSDQPGVTSERTGLHELESIETQRHWFTDCVDIACHESVNMLNLVEGAEVEVQSVDGSFEPMPVHYAETFIVPESVGCYRIVNKRPGTRVAVLQAFIRNLEG